MIDTSAKTNSLVCPFHGEKVVKCKLYDCDLWNKKHESHCLLTFLRSNPSQRDNNLAQGLFLTTSSLKEKLSKGILFLLRQSIDKSNPSQFVKLKESKGEPHPYSKWEPPFLLELESFFGLNQIDCLDLISRLDSESKKILTQDKEDSNLNGLLWQRLGLDHRKRAKKPLASLLRNPFLPSKEELLIRIMNSKRWKDS